MWLIKNSDVFRMGFMKDTLDLPKIKIHREYGRIFYLLEIYRMATKRGNVKGS